MTIQIQLASEYQLSRDPATLFYFSSLRTSRPLRSNLLQQEFWTAAFAEGRRESSINGASASLTRMDLNDSLYRETIVESGDRTGINNLLGICEIEAVLDDDDQISEEANSWSS